MKLNAIAILNDFASRFPLAWETFARVSPNVQLTDFAFVQDRGSFVATDAKGGTHAFRVYRDACIALVSPNGLFSFTDGEAVVL